MSEFKLCCVAMTAMMTLLLAGGLALAADGAPMTPELAAKRETVRQQEKQRVTPEKRKAAAAALKAERLRVYNAKKAAEQLQPGTPGQK